MTENSDLTTLLRESAKEPAPDLRSDKMQSMFATIQRTNIVTNIVTALLFIFSVGLEIWIETERAKFKLTDWAVGVYCGLLCFYALFFAFILAGEILIRRPYRRTIHQYVAAAYNAATDIMQAGGDANFILATVGDDLILYRENCEGYAQIDLSPLTDYPDVCVYIVRLTKKYLMDYYFINAERLHVTSVSLYNAVKKKSKMYRIFSPEKPLKSREHSYFIKHGLIEN